MAEVPHAVLQLAPCVQAQSADHQQQKRTALTQLDQGSPQKHTWDISDTGAEAKMHITPHDVHMLSLRAHVGGRTCELGPNARSAADVQSHEDERDQGQHRHGHRGVGQKTAMCMSTQIESKCLQG